MVIIRVIRDIMVIMVTTPLGRVAPSPPKRGIRVIRVIMVY